MSWAPLGSISVSRSWQTLGTLPAGYPLFRISQDWVNEWPGTGYLQVSFVYNGAGRYGFRKVGADKQTAYLLTAPIPESLVSVGLTSRDIAIRLNLYARLYSGANWVASVEQWTE